MSRMQKYLVLFIFTLPAVMALPGLALAAGPAGQSKVEYSAYSVTETEDAVIEGMVYHAPDRERREMNVSGEKMITLSRRDKKKSYMLMPADKAYMEMALGQTEDAGDLGGYEFEQTVIGPEEVDGIKTTKSKIIAKNLKTGHKFGGFWWTTKDDIVVKMDLLSVEKDGKARMKMQLRDLKIGKQDAKLFEIPADYSPINLGMPNMKELMGGGESAPAAEEAPAAEKPPAEEKKKGFGFKNLLDMVK